MYIYIYIYKYMYISRHRYTQYIAKGNSISRCIIDLLNINTNI